MMTSFWLAALVMLLIASIFVFVPLISYKNKVSKAGQTSNWFHAREQELAKEYAAGKYTEQEYQEALTELKLTTKDELTTVQTDNTNTVVDSLVYKPYLFTAVAGLFVIVSVFYINKGLYQQVDDWQQTLAKMPELSKKVIQNLDSQVSEVELREFALGLRTKLATKEDHIGWMLLGRVLMSLQDVDGAISSFEKSYNMQRNNVSNTVSFAQALQMKGEEFEIKRSLSLLQEALTLKPNNELAIILFGEGNLMLEHYEAAKKGFDFALQMLDKNDPRIGAIQDRLDFINKNLEPKPVVTTPFIQVSVNISAELKNKMAGFHYLFLFAKIDSMPMPIAVKKLPISTMPVIVTLSDTDMMIPGQKLSDYKTVSVFARLSVDDNAPFELGDWQGKQINIDTSNSDVINTVIINEEYK
ncbi:c-type cytochrome biogenesis protein CcmI [Psychrosphaera saromensis]|uniref:C-type cytochrome biogenesis protein CcmI n=1 Tax=Psychrosphaera saromensis TaxID=716813 RepID=A0A2S7UZL2_9GAMM|nr:c-type cytochrome biogenesis protein CcmI [Psychrosphaera saromensis]PQJ54710.1 c-type cytochrome biogenesis protein CcmI [Psychrosphaera saromensis]GHB57808.1 c-type cytochrome biogenesis protein CcmI [Psychrosphaera saromensis]GLQ14061.1 c-type cytochrome biogenesis protein CcmI [Psychrosphaera saromensis]